MLHENHGEEARGGVTTQQSAVGDNQIKECQLLSLALAGLTAVRTSNRAPFDLRVDIVTIALVVEQLAISDQRTSNVQESGAILGKRLAE